MRVVNRQSPLLTHIKDKAIAVAGQRVVGALAAKRLPEGVNMNGAHLVNPTGLAPCCKHMDMYDLQTHLALGPFHA